MEFDKQSIVMFVDKRQNGGQVVIVWAIEFTCGYSFYMGTWQCRCLQVLFNYSNIDNCICYLALCCVYKWCSTSYQLF